MKQKIFYFFSAFVCGAAVMAVEMSGTRLLAPYFGTSLFVWTNVISVIMVAMAVGYSLGGKLADRYPTGQAYYFWIGLTGLWVLAIPFLSPFILPALATGFGNLQNTLLIGSLVAVTVLLAFPMVLLGMNVPYTVRLTADDIKHIGSLSGKISTISTVGSLLGTFLPAFVLIPQLGTTKTFVFVGLTLFVLAGFGLRRFWLVGLGLLGSGLFWVTPPVYAATDLIASKESPYEYVFVTKDALGVRSLHIDNTIGIQSVYDPDSVLPSQNYYYGYFALLPTMVEQPQRVLILGHAGGTFTRIFNTYYPHLEITGVELDPAVTELAQETMGLDSARVTIVHADARQYLLNSDENYDLILVDTYHGPNIPAHLATQEFFELCHTHLNVGGVLALNAASTEGVFLDELSNSVAASFEHVFLFPVPSSFNTMLLARDGEGGFDVQSTLALDLNPFRRLYERIGGVQKKHDAAAAFFRDEKLSEVELKNEEMFMQLLAQF